MNCGCAWSKIQSC